MNIPINQGTLANLKAECTSLRDTMHRRAKSGAIRGCAFDRGREVLAIDASGNRLDDGEPWDWTGTMADLQDALAHFIERGAVEVSIDLGVDWAASPYDYHEGNYEPSVELESILIWAKPKATPLNVCLNDLIAREDARGKAAFLASPHRNI